MTAEAATRRVAHVPPAPGPMPPRWERGWGCGVYWHRTGFTVSLHETGGVSAERMPLVMPSELELALRDAADLVAWLRRGGR